MLQATFRPLTDWPIPDTKERRGTGYFKAGYGPTLQLLEKELAHLAAKNIVIQIQTRPSQIRDDGWPRSDARVDGPKVAVSFSCKYGQLTYRCDACVSWWHNLRCIAMTLERLRMAELYGVTKRGEQYQGFKLLGAGGEGGAGGGAIELDAMSMEEAIGCVAAAAEIPAHLVVAEDLKSAYQTGALRLHPDRPTGSAESFKRLQAADETLRRQWGVT